ncbi:MAG: hypothetical protein AAFX03_00385 [Pseudomonadota bacterium]
MPYSDAPAETPCASLKADSPCEELYRAGLAYSAGLGVEEDRVAAHKWFNLAALRGSEDAKIYRKEIADMMSSDEIREAQKAAREWLRTIN